jgi:hypothetical protein
MDMVFKIIDSRNFIVRIVLILLKIFSKTQILIQLHLTQVNIVNFLNLILKMNFHPQKKWRIKFKNLTENKPLKKLGF